MKSLSLIFIIVFISCQNKVARKEIKNENILVKENIESNDSLVLSKLWSQEQFRNNKDNKFRSLDDAYANPEKVVNLAVYSGFNNKIPDDIDVFKNVQLIGMNNNELTSLPESIGNLIYLQEVHLNKNQFTVFPAVLTKNRYLKTILFSDNKIEKIPSDIKNLIYLENLVLNDNNIKVLPQELFELSNLKVLGLRNNGLNLLPEEFGKLTKLEKLNLQNNNLKELPESIINLGSNLQRITLRGNPMSSSYVEELRKKMPNTEIEF